MAGIANDHSLSEPGLETGRQPPRISFGSEGGHETVVYASEWHEAGFGKKLHLGRRGP